MFELKNGAGAPNPGKAGILPGEKVNLEIALDPGYSLGEGQCLAQRHPEIGQFRKPAGLLIAALSVKVTGKPVGFKTVIARLRPGKDFFQP